MAKPKTKKASDLIEESIQVEGSTKEHILKTIFDGDASEIPTITSIGYMGLKGSNKFISYIITSKGKDILKIEVSEPDHRAIAEDESKINFVNCFMPGANE